MDRIPIEAALSEVERSLVHEQWSQLERYDAWLRREAVVAGGIGQDETSQLEARHLADSVLFALPWAGSTAPGSIVDVGSGVGLPGLVLAVMFPDTRLVLLDRSGRRCDLAQRAVRVLGLGNVRVVQQDVSQHDARYEGAVMRGVLPASRAFAVLARLLEPRGIGVVGLSRSSAPDLPPTLGEQHPDIAVSVAAGKVLDLPYWLLIMTRS